MLSHGWEFIANVDFYDTKSFAGKLQSEKEQTKRMEALVQRLAFLSASAQLNNLQACILGKLKEIKFDFEV